jgi:hypothetical protein
MTRGVSLGPAFGVAVAVMSSAAIVVSCGAQGLRLAGAVHPWCGTGTDYALPLLTEGVPPSFVIPALGWWLAQGSPRAGGIARCALLAAVTAYGTVLACAHGG